MQQVFLDRSFFFKRILYLYFVQVQSSELLTTQKHSKPNSINNNFNPDLVASLLMGRQNAAANGSRKRAFPDDEKSEKVDDFDDYDC